MSIVGKDGGELLPVPDEQEETTEVPLAPKESAEIKDATREGLELDKAFGKVSRDIIQMQAVAFEFLHRLGENEERLRNAHGRAIKSVGVKAERVRGFKPERGMLIISKKKSN